MRIFHYKRHKIENIYNFVTFEPDTYIKYSKLIKHDLNYESFDHRIEKLKEHLITISQSLYLDIQIIERIKWYIDNLESLNLILEYKEIVNFSEKQKIEILTNNFSTNSKIPKLLIIECLLRIFPISISSWFKHGPSDGDPKDCLLSLLDMYDNSAKYNSNSANEEKMNKWEIGRHPIDFIVKKPSVDRPGEWAANNKIYRPSFLTYLFLIIEYFETAQDARRYRDFDNICLEDSFRDIRRWGSEKHSMPYMTSIFFAGLNTNDMWGKHEVPFIELLLLQLNNPKKQILYFYYDNFTFGLHRFHELAIISRSNGVISFDNVSSYS